MVWAGMSIGNWKTAVESAKYQFEKSNRSKTFFAYLNMVALYQMSPSSSEELKMLAEEVPKHQLVIAGKHLHAEKFAIRKAR